MKNMSDISVKSAERVATGLAFAEGPAPVTNDVVYFVEIWGSRVGVWKAESGVAVVADVGGGPNAVCLGDGDDLYLTQNGGRERQWRATKQVPPSIQKISGAGVEIVVTEVDGTKLSAPNDLVFGPDGRLYFTDPGAVDHPYETPPEGRIFTLSQDGTGSIVFETGRTFPNGLAVREDGVMFWSESHTGNVCRLTSGATAADCLFSVPGEILDGITLAESGELLIASFSKGVLHVISDEGEHLASLPAGNATTNCSFCGTTLWVTEGDNGSSNSTPTGALWRLEVTGLRERATFRGTIG